MVDYIEIDKRMRYKKMDKTLSDSMELSDDEFEKLPKGEQTKIITAQKVMRKYMRRQICSHGGEYLVPLSDSRLSPRVKKIFEGIAGHDIHVCKRCSAVIDINIKNSTQDIDEVFLHARSMLYHIQMLEGDDISDGKRERIMTLHGRINRLEADLLKEYDQLLDEIPVKREW